MLFKLYSEILPRLGAFLGVFFVVMVIGYGILYIIDFVPETPQEEANTEIVNEDTSTTSELETALEFEESIFSNETLPISITIDALNRTVSVLNPNSRNITDLDNALLKGVVRHPDSADFTDDKGNILILGHSSYLNTVLNKNFQAFNGIQNLTWGDTIRLRSNDTEYIYQVDRVYQDKASAITIPTKATTAKLTLATCNTFGAKEDRFIVEATLVSKKAL